VRSNNSAPSAAAPIDPAEVKRIFGETLGRVPAEEVTFLFYFNEGTTVLTAESEALFPRLLEVAAERKATLISVTGHTDTTGVSRDSNQRLGMARAEAVATRLRAIGVKPETLLIRSHGQDDLLVPTPPKTAEQKNRRVEVIIR
jgi:outer membrane protein OmpA-like peptidoglycan-associated protein